MTAAPTPWRRRLRLMRRGIWYALAALLVLLALGNGIGSQLLPLAERHPERIAEWLSVRAQRPVAFDDVQTQWTRRGPLLRLGNLRVGDPANPVRIGDAEVLVAQYAGLLPGRSFTELRVRGLDLTLQRDAQGRWSVRGLPGQQQAQDGDPFETLERLGELQVSHARLRVLAPEIGIDTRLPRIDLRMRVDGTRIRGGADAWLREGATPFAIAADFDRAKGDGRVYVGSRRIDLGEAGGLVALRGISAVAGNGRIEAWGRLHAHRIVSLRTDTELRDVALRGLAQEGADAGSHALGDVSLAASWKGSPQAWQVHAPRLRLGKGEQLQRLDGLALAGGDRIAVRAERVELAPLLQLLALSDVGSPSLRAWLGAAHPGALLQDLRVDGVRGGRLQASARIDGLRFDPVGHKPGMRGVGGWLQGDQDGLRLRFDPSAVAAFDWPSGFGVVHEFTLDGEAVAWREGAGWVARTPGLAIDRGALKVNARGGIGFDADGTRPRLDIAADIGTVPVSVARGFWIHHLMPKSTVDWLDAALQGGRLQDAHAVVVGDLDDWPFRNEAGLAGAGLFRAQARIRDGVVKFQPDWPAAEAVNADVRFIADGFDVDGQARIAGVQVERVQGGIQRFGRAELELDAEAASDARNFLAMLVASPLHQQYGEIMDNLRATGPASADLHLLLPFHHEQAPSRQVRGNVRLAGATLREQRWKLAFEDVEGAVRYDEGGFLAEGLRVVHEGTPGQLSLRAGPHAKDASQAFEAELTAKADIDGLLDKADGMAWLKPHVSGSSEWTVEVGVPRGSDAGQASPTQLRLRSTLAGTEIALPAPLRKPAGQAMPAVVDVRLPMEQGEVELSLGNLLSLRSRTTPDQTGVRVQFGGARADAPPVHGLAVGGQVDRLEALDWISVLAADRGAGKDAIPLRRVDVHAQRLRLLGAEFADSRLVLAPAPQGIAVQVEGDALAGALLVPSQEGATVAGRFDRFHWARAQTTKASRPAGVGTGAVATEAGDPPASTFNPAAIPPLLFEVGDLRVAKVSLGSARFRSVPAPAGLRLEEFTTSGGGQRLSAKGVWSGQGSAERTQLDLDLDSDDIAALLDGFGLDGQLDDGKGKLGVAASWRGGPEAWSLKTLQADIALDARDGRLLEIEPGAGRVLGLLGIGQLPRRLTLDFRDIFEKGFAFDRVHGQVRIANGSARTSDLSIEGPAADIHVSGSADLRAQRFDQAVHVRPKSGGLLTAVGALTAGPVGAAVGAVANAVLEKPLQGVGARTYRVTGPWKSPKVETIESPRQAVTPRQDRVEGDG